ncbi:MAG: Phosphoserine aminotransferase [Candidatus Tokpelaia hoelldobleri]|uniref:phosphoserine transaminase n=1 Tax=Candidatus Tokpelaia hoelldobleri TaxID=1902579 RepID=A0A1U9JT12_9HYPH|nr:MAG: Phosphoserine aminotransferase [Candidatus Tokpelaia hoelldoblerii]
MTDLSEPAERPVSAAFSSGPCSKRPGWALSSLQDAPLGRSHRARIGKAKLAEAINLTREILAVPADYRIGIVPASDTGAVEMALWSLLGARGVDIAAWESFGAGWVSDVTKQLKLPDVRVFDAPYGELPDLSRLDFDRDVVFTWNGTTSGVRVPDADFIPAGREGLTICDATSAAFAQNLDFTRLDVVTYSWQKVLGGEGGHGVLILSPRAVERLESYTPAWPLPKIFRLTRGGKLIEGIFTGETINTPSMLCVEDYLDGLKWAKSLGGLPALQARADKNFAVLDDFVQKTPWLENLAQVPETRSNTSVCLVIVDPQIRTLDAGAQAAFARAVVSRLENAGIAYDIGAYRDAPSGLRIWTGATIEAADVQALTLWLDWAFAAEKAALGL